MKKIDWENIFDGQFSESGHVYCDQKVSQSDREFGRSIIAEFKGVNYQENPEMETQIRTQTRDIDMLKVYSCVNRHIVAIAGGDRKKFSEASYIMFIRKGKLLLRVAEIGAHCDIGTSQWSYRNSDGSCDFNLENLKGLTDIMARTEQVYENGCDNQYH